MWTICNQITESESKKHLEPVNDVLAVNKICEGEVSWKKNYSLAVIAYYKEMLRLACVRTVWEIRRV